MTEQESRQVAPTRTDAEYLSARKRLEARRDFGAHLVSFVVVNVALVGVWAMTGGGYFWPAWVIGLWGVGLVLHGWEVFFRRPVTDADIQRELRKHQT